MFTCFPPLALLFFCSWRNGEDCEQTVLLGFHDAEMIRAELIVLYGLDSQEMGGVMVNWTSFLESSLKKPHKVAKIAKTCT